LSAADLELVAADARVAVAAAIGGALAAFDWRGHPVLRPMSDAGRAAGDVRQSACYPLVPYSNRLRDARLRFADRDHTLARNFGDHPHAIHGVGWQRAWTVLQATPSGATLVLDHAALGADGLEWPWPFRATQSFALTADASHAMLVATLAIANAGAAPFPFGLGWHPYLPRDPSTTLRFAARDVWLNDATQLPLERRAATGPWSFATARAPGDDTIDNVFSGWKGRATLASAHAGRATRIVADRACDHLVVFAPAGRDFVAVEPVTHSTDAFNRAAAGATDTGMRTLPPGAAFSCTMRIDVSALR